MAGYVNEQAQSIGAIGEPASQVRLGGILKASLPWVASNKILPIREAGPQRPQGLRRHTKGHNDVGRDGDLAGVGGLRGWQVVAAQGSPEPKRHQGAADGKALKGKRRISKETKVEAR